MRFGVIPDESLADYHGNEAVSKTRLDTFRAHRELYRKIYVSKELPRPDPTAAMIFGQRAGCYIMEGIRAFRDRYYVIPQGTGRQKTEHKALRAQLLLEHPGKEGVDFDDFQTIRGMDAALRRNPQFVELTSLGRPEVTFRIQGQHFAVQVRPDWWNEEGCALTDGYPLIVDLKTIAALPEDEPDHLSKHISEYGYHRSAFLYPEIVKLALKWKPDLPRPRFFLAFVEKEEPFNTEVVELPDFDVEVGEREVTDSLRQLRRCLETGVWTEPKKEIRQVSLPGYYVRRSVESTEAFIT